MDKKGTKKTVTLEDRLEAIEAAADAEAFDQAQAELEKDMRLAALQEEASALFGRADGLCQVAEKMAGKKEKFPGYDDLEPFWYRRPAMTQSALRGVGFVKLGSFYVGRWCQAGWYVLEESGLYLVKPKGGKKPATAETIEVFLWEFPMFEKAFLEWFDMKYIGKKKKEAA